VAKKNVKMNPLPDESARIAAVLRSLEVAQGWMLSRQAGSEPECLCEADDLIPHGDGPCNRCEQAIFAWDALKLAVATMRPMVRKRWAGEVESSETRRLAADFVAAQEAK
jgi:hypothetical protein